MERKKKYILKKFEEFLNKYEGDAFDIIGYVQETSKGDMRKICQFQYTGFIRPEKE